MRSILVLWERKQRPRPIRSLFKEAYIIQGHVVLEPGYQDVMLVYTAYVSDGTGLSGVGPFYNGGAEIGDP